MDKKVFLKKSVILTIVRMTQVIIGFVITLLITKYFGEDVFGAYSYGLATILLIGILVTQGLPSYCAYCAVENRTSSNFLKVIYLFVIIMSSCVSLLLIYGINWIDVEKKEVIVQFLPMLIVMPLLQINCGLLIGKNKTYQSELIQFFLRPMIMALLVLIMVVTTMSIELNYIVYNQIFATSIPLLLSFYYVYKNIDTSKFSINLKSEILSSLSFFGAKAGMLANQQIGIVFVGTFLTFNDVASFRIAEQISLILSLGLHALNSIMTPHIKSAINLDFEKEKINKLIKYLTRILFLMVLIISIFLFIFSKYLYDFMGFQSNHDSLLVLNILIIGQIANVITGCNGLVLTMSGNAGLVSRISIMIFLITVGLFYITLDYLDIIDVACIIVASKITYNIILTFAVFKKTNINTTVF